MSQPISKPIKTFIQAYDDEMALAEKRIATITEALQTINQNEDPYEWDQLTKRRVSWTNYRTAVFNAKRSRPGLTMLLGDVEI